MKAFYINLDYRTDRKEHIENQAKKYELDIERYPAVCDTEYPVLGCMLSHTNVLKLARERSLESVLIFEDDFIFLVETNEFKENLKILEKINFDVCMLSHNNLVSVPTTIPELLHVKFAQTASGYIVRSHYYDKLIELYEWAYPLLKATKQEWVYMNDIVWRDLQAKDLWLTFKTRQGKQMAGYSDLGKSYFDYGC
jgi:GR25 family glycosyltransferase involved in LPS biosynthesis